MLGKEKISTKYRSYFKLVVLWFLLTGQDSLILGMKGGSVDNLEFVPGGKDFYQKFVKQSKPVVFVDGVMKADANASLSDISKLEMKLSKEVFDLGGEENSFFPSYNESGLESKDIELKVKDSKILDQVYLPIMLNCKEYKLAYNHFRLSIVSHMSANPPTQVDEEMLIFSFGGGIEVELFDSKYSPYFLGSLEKGKKDGNILSDSVILNEGDILYVPKYWWIKMQAKERPMSALKLFFNLEIADVHQHKDDRVSRNLLKDIEAHIQLLSQLPGQVSCTSRPLSLRHVLKINESDPRTLQLRLPKKAERPRDVILQSGYTMPVFGLGTALLNDKTAETVKDALSLGYRLIDTAQGYPGSEAGIAQAMLESSVPRSEIFILTKLHPRFLGHDSTIKAIDMSLKSLNVDYIDLFLIHSKECDDYLLKCQEGEPYGTWRDSWKAMEHAHKLGKIRSLGVSNFNVGDLKVLQEIASVPISVVQNWFDPIHQDRKMRQFCRKFDIRYMGYSTLGGMWKVLGIEKNPILTSSLLTDLSTHYDYFVSSLVLGWAIHQNVTVIPRSSNKNHLAQNLRALDMKISEIDISEIDSMATILEEVVQGLEDEEQDSKDHETQGQGVSTSLNSDSSFEASPSAVDDEKAGKDSLMVNDGENGDLKGNADEIFDKLKRELK